MLYVDTTWWTNRNSVLSTLHTLTIHTSGPAVDSCQLFMTSATLAMQCSTVTSGHLSLASPLAFFTPARYRWCGHQSLALELVGTVIPCMLWDGVSFRQLYMPDFPAISDCTWVILAVPLGRPACCLSCLSWRRLVTMRRQWYRGESVSL